LEPAVNGSYFQIADLTKEAEESAKRYHMKVPEGPIVGKNIIGILRGSDPKLRETYIIVSAHYDHIGTTMTAMGRAPKKAPENSADKIYNGANDDGSGTVSVIALAEAFSKLRQKPKRSIIFAAFCGEEWGLLGSKYYAEHPVAPLNETIANINLEQIGRTDGDIKKGSASLTGFEYTSLGKLFQRAGKTFGVHVYRDEQADKYFRQSDNLSFAEHGIPDTTICTAFEFPDYHGLKDEWQRIDYADLTLIDRVLATAVEAIANSRTRPEWDANVPAAEKYRKAAETLYGGDGRAVSK
jgi:Zn-dependent M28 family amino/carboxypeptidase